MLIVGSRALINAGVEIHRKPKDIDYIMSWEEFISFRKTRIDIKACYPLNDHKWVIKHSEGIDEVEIAWEGSSGEWLLSICGRNMISIVDLIYTLKMSHRYLKDNPHFLKTMLDIHHLRALGASIPYELQEWLVVREKETYTYKHPKLNTAKGDFFNTEGVTYIYDHDSIHEAVKLYDKPCYQYFKPAGSEVWCDKRMFDNLPTQIKLGAVFEESVVLAIERALVPFNSWSKEELAFKKALEKVCTSITSGWFREYAWENYHSVLGMYYTKPRNYIKSRFDSGIENKVIFNQKEEMQHE
jgi:hypothetical protein